MRPASAAVAGALLVFGGPAHAADPQTVTFIACPIYRDTNAGPKSGCWLADDPVSGKRFDISDSPVKPDWNAAVLVEGVVSSEPTVACGGDILNPVRVSVLRDRHCTRVMLPGEAFLGHRFKLPTRLIRPAYAPPETFPHPYMTRTFEVPFSFDSAFLNYQMGDYFVNEAVAYAIAVHAKDVRITGWAATRPEAASGEQLAERPGVAQERANLAARWMRDLGVDPSVLHLAWHDDAAPLAFDGNDGLLPGSTRRVDIVVIPGGQ